MKIKLSKCNPELGKDFIYFDCPLCEDGHPMRIPFNKIGGKNKHGQIPWLVTGKISIETLTLSPSILTTGGASNCKFHGWIKNGEIQY